MRAAALLLLLACAGSLPGEFRAGAAKSVITPDLARFGPVYIAGFGRNRAATGVRDDLYARCTAFSTGARPLVICSADLIGLFLDDTDRVRALVREKVPADVVVACTHVHEGPDTMGLWGPSPGRSGLNEEYNRFAVERIAEAAVAAVRDLRPAVLKLARVSSPELNRFLHDNRPPVVHDPDLLVLHAAARSGSPIATVVNWANHPEALGSKNTLLSADYAASLYAALERKNGGMAALWVGALGGMQSPLGAAVGDAETIGRRVAELAVEAVEAAGPATVDSIAFRRTLVDLPLANPNFHAAVHAGLFKGRKQPRPDGTTSARVGYIRMSRRGRPVLEVALVPGELYPELSVGGVQRYPGADFPDAPTEPALKTLLTAPYRMLVGLADDEIGYIIPKAQWDEKPPYLRNAPKPWYGEVNSPGPETAPRLMEAFDRVRRP